MTTKILSLELLQAIEDKYLPQEAKGHYGLRALLWRWLPATSCCTNANLMMT